MLGEESLARGDLAMAEGRWLEARSAYEQALQESGSPRALASLGDVLFFLGESEASVECRERAYATYRRAGNIPEAVDSALWLCLMYQSALGNMAAGRGWLARAESLLGDSEEGQLGAWLTYCRALFSPELEQSQELMQQAWNTARAIGDIDLELCALADLGVICVKLGRLEEGLRHVDEAMAGALAGDRTTPYTVVMTSCSMLNVCDLVADLDRARQWARAADEFTNTYGCPYLYAECRIAYGRVLVLTGHWAEAEVELSRALQATRHAFGGLYSRAVSSLADLRLRQGRTEDARTLVESIDEPIEAALIASALALREGEPASAIALAERWLQGEPNIPMHAGGRGASIETAFAYSLLVEAHLGLGNREAAEGSATRLHELASFGSGAPFLKAMAALTSGRVARAVGDSQAAIRWFEQALSYFAQIELPLEAARARLDLAQALPPEQRALAVSEARVALQTFDRLGASHDGDVASALLRSWGASGRSMPRSDTVLTKREQEILSLLSEGLSNNKIASRLYISRKTAAHHVSNLLAKLGVRNRTEAASYAARRGGAAGE